MAGSKLQLRLDPELSARLDEDARATNVTRSDMARFILERALTNDAERAAAKTVIWSILAKLRQNEGSLLLRLRLLIAEYVGGTFASEAAPVQPTQEEGPDDDEEWGEGATDGLPRK